MNDASALRRLVACCLTASGLSARARLNPEKARRLAEQIERCCLYDAGHWAVPEAVLPPITTPGRPEADEVTTPGPRAEIRTAHQVALQAVRRGIDHARALAADLEHRDPVAARNLTRMLTQNGLTAGAPARRNKGAPEPVYNVGEDAPEELRQNELAGMVQVSGPDFIRHARTWLLGDARLEALEDGVQLFLPPHSGALRDALPSCLITHEALCIGSASHSGDTYFIVPPGQPLTLARVMRARQQRRARAMRLTVAQVQQRANDTCLRLSLSVPDQLPLTLLVGHHPGYALSAIVGQYGDDRQQQLVIMSVRDHLELAAEMWRQLKRPPAGGPVPDPSTSGGASTEVTWSELSSDLLSAAEALWPSTSRLPQTG